MELTLREIKRNARRLMKSAQKPKPLTVALVFTLITAAASFFLGRIGGATAVIDNARLEELNRMMQAGQLPSFAEYAQAVEIRQPKSDSMSSLLELALQLVSVIVTAGFSLYALRVVRGLGGELGNLLDGFAQFYRVTIVYLLQALFIMLGLFCFVVPGILLFYSYRMATYLLWDHPDWSPLQCLRASRLLMHGRRGKIFAMDMSFLLWLILGGIPFSVAGYCLDYELYGSMLCALAAGCALSAFVSLYRELTLSLWYNTVLNLMKEKETEVKPPWET